MTGFGDHGNATVKTGSNKTTQTLKECLMTKPFSTYGSSSSCTKDSIFLQQENLLKNITSKFQEKLSKKLWTLWVRCCETILGSAPFTKKKRPDKGHEDRYNEYLDSNDELITRNWGTKSNYTKLPLLSGTPLCFFCLQRSLRPCNRYDHQCILLCNTFFWILEGTKTRKDNYDPIGRYKIIHTGPSTDLPQWPKSAKRCILCVGTLWRPEEQRKVWSTNTT